MSRTADGKPDMTGVWQGGSNRVGTWEEANGPDALGGSRPGATPAGRANAIPAREAPPYQDWAKQKLLESFNRRAAAAQG